jgi:elongation factor 1-beta
MADVIVTVKIMPDSPEADLKVITDKATEIINKVGEVGKTEEEPIAFGLKAIKLMFVMSEDKGSTETIENEIAALEHINSVEVIDVRRALG